MFEAVWIILILSVAVAFFTIGLAFGRFCFYQEALQLRLVRKTSKDVYEWNEYALNAPYTYDE